MPTRRACVIGAGVAGLATAMRLCRSDWEVVLIDRESPAHHSRFPHALRGVGHDAATRLGLLPGLDAASQPRCDVMLIDAAGSPLALQPKPSVPLLCPDDVAAVLHESLGDGQTRRSIEVAGLVQDDCGVTVRFSDGSEDWFDLVVGAESTLGEVAGAERHRRHQAFATLSGRLETGWIGAVSMASAERAVHVHPLRDGSSAVLFTWRGDAPAQAVFDDLGWLPPDFWSDVDTDRTVRRTCSGTHSDRWALRQIALLGEATCCAEQLHESTALAIGGAELLGDALDIFTDTAEALAWWEKHLRRTVRRQSAGFRSRKVLAWSSPSTRSAKKIPSA